MSALSSSLSFLIQTLGGLYIMAVLIRFLLQLVRADFYNPISQAIVKATSPLLNPIRKIIPGYGGVDMASLVLALILQIALLYVLLLIGGFSPATIPFPSVLISSLIKLGIEFLNIYMFSLIIIAIASWVAPNSYNPGLMLLFQITEPLTSRIRKVIPPLGGLDFSLMVLVIIIITLKNFLGALA
ncbi:YggT family protein [Endozoicomonas sp. GU-1]|uniref:YggT family protein n=1 Tax=unclassified Endozoicomonas TaxID=2644528 RepID=UPI0022B3ACF0|nr:YggT family protein [Endozoicomonas sp. GU-1]WBA81134.1 YggT family protein [Endozoicomonas sp. GU-1]WBA88700.1 YggT family protein [Endozoicomonas sp. GU-1]